MSARMKQRKNHWTDFHEILLLESSVKFVDTFRILYVQYTFSATLTDFEIIKNKDIMHTFQNVYVKQSAVVSRIQQMPL
jgi:hypothetical protein